MEKSTFGNFIREQRLGIPMTLREFCLKNKVDCVILSKIERGIQLPKRDELRRLSEALKILDDSVEYRELLKLYETFQREEHEVSCADLPVFLPPDITEERIQKLLEMIGESYTPTEKDLFVEG